MVNTKTILSKSRNFVLSQEYTSRNIPVYIISYNSVHLHAQLENIRDMLDPERTIFLKKVRFRYRYANQKNAEQNYMMLVLKWP